MMRRSSQNYVCWRCLSLRPAERALLPRRTPSATAAFSALASTTPARGAPVLLRHRYLPHLAHPDRSQSRSVSTESPASATVSETASDPPADLTLDWANRARTLRSSSEQSNIREQLRIWEAQNPGRPAAIPSDEPTDGRVGNIFTKARGEVGFSLDVATMDDEATRAHFDAADMVDLSQSGPVLQAGDLVEVSSESWKIRLLAICLGVFEGYHHFYANNGKWFTSRSLRTGFVVKNFIDDPAELHAVVEAIPSLSPSSIELNALQDIGPSRDLAASLIRKMHKFQVASRNIHQTYVERLSLADKQLGKEERLLSLREIADALLPLSLKRNKGAFPPEALYAVYSVLDAGDVAFRPLDRGARHGESYMFAFHSAEVQQNVTRIEQLVRGYYEYIGGQSGSDKGRSAPTPAKFTAFLKQARDMIDQVRKDRKWSPYGMIGPSEQRGSAPSTLEVPVWTETSLAILKFMEHWAATDGLRSGSRYHWIGASVLRAVGRYDDAMLDSTTGWTFLQEIGWIPPWDVSARHALRLPEQKLDRHIGLLPHTASEAAVAELGPDRLAELRQDFARSTVYCIDAADTLDVDDGISLEALGNGEYWIHIHVADPASRISPDHEIAKQGALKAQTSYLAGFYQRMLDRDDVRDTFSLGPNQPTLTFSARVDESGRLLDSKITPGILRDVVYITPEDVSSVVGDADPSALRPDVLEVGTRPVEDASPVRRMTTPGGLSRGQTSELKTLSKLAGAIQRVRLDNGATPAFLPKPKAVVSLDGVTPGATNGNSAFYSGDPYIRVVYGGQGNSLVSSLMQLAGEVGARWCYEREIPIPYRLQLLAGQNSDALRAFNRDVFHPQLAAGKNPPAEDWHTLRSLVGGYDISTTPASNLSMGLDLYTKVTSPLRRYPDLLVHWQIEAAILEEHRRDQSLAVRKFVAGNIGNEAAAPSADGKTSKKEPLAFLPFSKKQLDDTVLPRLRIRERHGKLIDNVDGNSQWILQALVRAWRFGDTSAGSPPLPKSFRFTVSDVTAGRSLKGRIDWFDQLALVELADMKGVARVGDVKTGDVFEVELANVNVHANKIYVRLLKKI
ncbi:RNB domain-containing protein [Chaetomium fimeti]|uniref:RNB domain-containing protein n=1 Tax=Chaetomium fimeti TaxID=1854472 RepID=A0AAE0HRL9_9PEZI|nr:RNB domain-containing protein [Chaetomium fimeti]